MDWDHGVVQPVSFDRLGQRYRRYRLVDPQAEAAMAGSLRRWGQLSPAVACVRGEDLELLDGFKRLAAARQVAGQTSLSVRVVELDEPMAKAAILGLNRGQRAARELEEALSGRLGALAIAHELIGVGKSRPAAIEEIDLHELLEAIAKPYLSGMSGRFKIAGPKVRLGIKAITSFALVLHELTTNAAKYGAFSHSKGKLEVEWLIAGDCLALSWTEIHPGALQAPPKHQGFGSKLVKTSVEHQLDGRIEFHWKADGVRIALNIPLARLQS